MPADIPVPPGMPLPAGKILDLVPMIRRRQKSGCEHLHVEIGDPEASLTCCDCGAELDPWLYLRTLANDPERWEKREGDYHARWVQIEAEHNAWLARINETRQRLAAEIQHLTDVKNRLSNEMIGDARLGSLAARRRPRRKR